MASLHLPCFRSFTLCASVFKTLCQTNHLVLFVYSAMISWAILLSSNFSRNLGSILKMSTHVLSNSRKHIHEAHRENFGQCCCSTGMTATCCTGRKSLYSYSDTCVCVGEFKSQPINSGCWTPTSCVLSLLLFIIYKNWIDQGSGTYGSRVRCGFLMTASGSLDIFLTRLLRMKLL